MTSKKLGTTVVSGRTPGHLGNRSNSTDRSFLIRSIWRLHGALSGHFIYLAFLYLSPRPGILSEQCWVHIAGCRTIINVGIVYFFSVR